MFFVFCVGCLLCTAFGELAEGHQACSVTTEGMSASVATDEAVALVQSKASAVSKTESHQRGEVVERGQHSSDANRSGDPWWQWWSSMMRITPPETEPEKKPMQSEALQQTKTPTESEKTEIQPTTNQKDGTPQEIERKEVQPKALKLDEKPDEIEKTKEVQPETGGQTVDSEISLLGEPDIKKVRFRALHKDWVDILDLYSDGFFQRYHGGDAGVWTLNKNQVVLKWIQWQEERLQSKDGGQTFATADNASFTLRSFVRPVWWSRHFDNIGTQVADGSETVDFSNVNMAKIIAAHITGRNADLDEMGYSSVAAARDNTQMEIFIRRLAESMKLDFKSEGDLHGMVPYFSGVEARQTYEKLVAELTDKAYAVKPVS